MKLSATQFEHTRAHRGTLSRTSNRCLRRSSAAQGACTGHRRCRFHRHRADAGTLQPGSTCTAQRAGQRGADARRRRRGVPGALSNQPPAAGNAPENAQGPDGQAADAINSSRQATRNYELDRGSVTPEFAAVAASPCRWPWWSTISPTSTPTATSACVSVPRGDRTPTDLVREAVGFDTRRGDSVRVLNSSFLSPEPVADLPGNPDLGNRGWFLDTVKQVGGLLLVLVLIFVVLKPTMKRLTARHAELAARQPAAHVSKARWATARPAAGTQSDEGPAAGQRRRTRAAARRRTLREHHGRSAQPGR